MSVVTVATSPYVLGAGKVLTAADQDAILLHTTDAPADVTHPGDITISGRIEMGNSDPAHGKYLHAITVDLNFAATDSLIHITSGGAIHAATTGFFWTAIGIAGNYDPRIVNDGTISASSEGEAYGIIYGTHLGGGSDPAVVNNGTISITAGARGMGVQMYNGELFQNAGVVDVKAGAWAIGVDIEQHNGGFLNTGTIRTASDHISDEPAIAVKFMASLTRGFLNAGTLQGDYALFYRGTPDAYDDPGVTIENTGRMIGAVSLGYKIEHLVNSGLIQGDVDLGDGDDIYSGGGTTTGMVMGGAGNDSLSGGSGFDNFQGNQGSDTEHGWGGDDWVVGGKDADLLFGDDGNDLIYGNIGADTCDGGAGADTIRGGQDGDLISGGDGNDWLSGDRGDDTIAGGAGADTFYIFADAGTDRVTDFNAAEGDRVQLDPGTSYTVTQSGADTVISLSGGAQMILVGVTASSLPPGWLIGA